MRWTGERSRGLRSRKRWRLRLWNLREKAEKEEGCGRFKRASFFQKGKPKPVSQLRARPPRSFNMGP